jgi:AcrR family transcriptional regulator
MKTTRNYVMRTRAESAGHTRQRALEATVALAGEKPFATIVLPEVAARAGVSVQTVLRQFGSRDGLLDAATEFVGGQLRSHRSSPPGNVRAALQVLFDHYEAHGDAVIMLLGQEGWDRRAAHLTESERAAHRAWVSTAFAPQLADRTTAARTELVDMLVVATDVYTWKLLCRDRALTRVAAQRRVSRMVSAMLSAD